MEFLSLSSMKKEWEFIINSALFTYILIKDYKVLIIMKSYILTTVISILMILNINLYLNIMKNIISLSTIFDFIFNLRYSYPIIDKGK